MRIMTIVTTAVAVAIVTGQGWCGSSEPMPQGVSEAVVDLSKEAQKGYLFDTKATENGGFEVIYGMKGKKKDDKVTYEVYPFDASMVAGKSYKTETVKVKESYLPAEPYTMLVAKSGGTNSFNGMSMKIRLEKQTFERSLNPETNKFKYKYISKSDIKLKKEDDDRYDGYCSFESNDNTNVVLVSYEANKSLAYSVLFFDKDANKKEVPIPFDFPQSVVYCALLPVSDSVAQAGGELDLTNSDIGIFFAPKKDSKNVKQMTFIRMDRTGAITERLSFDRPLGPMVITSVQMLGGSLYGLGMSIKDVKSAFEDEFGDFASIRSSLGESWWETRYYSDLRDVKYETINLFKITAGKLDFIGNTPVKELKKIAKPATGQKKAMVYDGSNISVGKLFTTKDGNLVASFSTVNFSLSNNYSTWEYTGFYYMLFNSSAAVVAEYGVARLSDDKKDRVFKPFQLFDDAASEATMWTVLEPKGFKGYANWSDAFNDRVTITARFYPRTARTNLATGTTDFQYTMGHGEYFLYSSNYSFLQADSSARVFIGSDKNGKKLWVGKIALK